MKERSVTHHTFVIEREYGSTPERVFADSAKKRRWFAEGEGMEVEEFEMDFRAGGKEGARFRIRAEGPLKGTVLQNDTTYQDIVPNSRVVFAYTMTVADKRISASLATIELVAVDKGTRLTFTEQGAFFEGADGPQIRRDGWSQLLEKLAIELTH